MKFIIRLAVDRGTQRGKGKSDVMTYPEELAAVLEGLWPKNKAKGLLAQTVLSGEVERGAFGGDARDKLMPGCWLVSPKEHDFFKFRFAFFVHPSIMRTETGPWTDLRSLLGEKYRPFHAVSEFLNSAGIGVIYAVPNTRDGTLPLTEVRNSNFENINWSLYRLSNGEFAEIGSREFFGRWEGERGRPSRGGDWDPGVRQEIRRLDGGILLKLVMNELFYAGFLKGVLRKPLNDPYDVDAFMVSLSQKHILPMEIKEKFPGSNRNERYFGIDAGRIMMLLRLALPNDANALYIVRETDEQGGFRGWKYTTLSEIVMTSSWNLQAGGRGMGGQSTQTVRLPYSQFKTFDRSTLSEDSLKRMGELPREIREMAVRFREELSSKFYGGYQ